MNNNFPIRFASNPKYEYVSYVVQYMNQSQIVGKKSNVEVDRKYSEDFLNLCLDGRFNKRDYPILYQYVTEITDIKIYKEYESQDEARYYSYKYRDQYVFRKESYTDQGSRLFIDGQKVIFRSLVRKINEFSRLDNYSEQNIINFINNVRLNPVLLLFIFAENTDVFGDKFKKFNIPTRYRPKNGYNRRPLTNNNNDNNDKYDLLDDDINNDTENYDELPEELPKLAKTVEWLNDEMNVSEAASQPGKWFYNTRETNKDKEIVRIYDHTLLDMIRNRRNPYTNQLWDSSVLKRFTIGDLSGGGNPLEKKYYLYNKRHYLVRVGPRGGKFIVVKGDKHRI